MAWAWFSIFFHKPFVGRVKRRIPMRIVRLARSMQLVEMCAGSGLPIFTSVLVPLHFAELQRVSGSDSVKPGHYRNTGTLPRVKTSSIGRCCFLAAIMLGALPLTAADRPNVLFIVADDLGYGDLGCYGNSIVETPAIDRLASEGVRLTSYYSPSPLCAPARAGLLTGRFNHRTGAVDVSSNRGIDRIALSEKTFGDYFRAAGYRTALIGKWHNGLYNLDYLPHRRGFDLFYGFPNGGQDYWKWNLLRNDVPVPHDGRYLTDALNEEAIRFIEARSERPFALFLAHHAPHGPFQAPAELVAKYRRRVENDTVATIYAMIETMDRGLGRLFERLEDRGSAKDTIVVFTSDNGADLRGAQRFHGPFSGNKGDVREQGIRVPAIVRWAGEIPAGSISAEPIHGVDWLPTLYALTGAAPPESAMPLDGTDILPALTGDRPESLADRRLPFQKNRYTPVAHSDAAIRLGPWKLYWPGVAPTMTKDGPRDNPSYRRGIVEPHWEMPLDPELPNFAGVRGAEPRLFRLDADPGETEDLAGDHPEVVQELRERYDAWFADVFREWRAANTEIRRQDDAYWEDRAPPDPRRLFSEYWIWGGEPRGDPLAVFKGYWNRVPRRARGQ